MTAAGEEACPSHFIDFVRTLPDITRPLAQKHFRTTLEVDDKEDASPVTIADRAIEQALRTRISEHFPDHGLLGEEYGQERGDAPYCWVLDPIDGTKSFVTGKPTFGTLIALAHHGVPILGVIDMPALQEVWIGAVGHGTEWNGQAVKSRSCASLDKAFFQATSPFMFVSQEEKNAHNALSQAVKHPLYGADCYAYGLLACGWVDIVFEASLQPYDFMALVPVVEGAGGLMRDWQGNPLTITSAGQVVACGDPTLMPAALSVLAQSQEEAA